jgi:hypothetical protein
MGAIAALFTTVKGGELVAFLSFVMMILLDIELLISLTRTRHASDLLVAFGFFSQTFLGAVAVFLIQSYATYVSTYISQILIIIVCSWFFVPLNRKLKSRKKAVIAVFLMTFIASLIYNIIAFYVLHL